MAIRKFFSIAYRNLVRNGRRTTLTALAVALGLMVVFAMASLIDGMLKINAQAATPEYKGMLRGIV